MSRENLLFMAKVYDKCRRSDDCWNTVLKLLDLKADLNPEQRSLFAAAYKTYCSQRKMHIRDFNEIQKIEEKQGKVDLAPLRELRQNTTKQIREASLRCLQAVDKFFGKSPNAQAEITAIKLRGDAAKYLYDVESGQEKKKYANLAYDYYQDAFKRSEKLKTTHPVRLGLALGYSVFLDGVLRDTVRACQVAKKAFDQGSRDLDERDKEFFQDASALLNMLKQNLTFWTSELEKNIA